MMNQMCLLQLRPGEGSHLTRCRARGEVAPRTPVTQNLTTIAHSGDQFTLIIFEWNEAPQGDPVEFTMDTVPADDFLNLCEKRIEHRVVVPMECQISCVVPAGQIEKLVDVFGSQSRFLDAGRVVIVRRNGSIEIYENVSPSRLCISTIAF